MGYGIRYGLVEGSGKGREVPLMASQYFHRQAGHFVQLIAGNASLCASGIGRVFGWAESPKQADGYDAWKGSATAEADKLFVIYADPDNVFGIPATRTTVAASLIGKGAGLILGGSTYTWKQFAKVGGSVTASPVFVVDVDTTNKILYVKVKQTKRQAN